MTHGSQPGKGVRGGVGWGGSLFARTAGPIPLHGIDLLALIVNTVRKIGWLDVVSCRRGGTLLHFATTESRGLRYCGLGMNCNCIIRSFSFLLLSFYCKSWFSTGFRCYTLTSLLHSVISSRSSPLSVPSCCRGRAAGVGVQTPSHWTRVSGSEREDPVPPPSRSLANCFVKPRDDMNHRMMRGVRPDCPKPAHDSCP